MKTNAFLILLLFLFILNSCKKDIDNDSKTYNLKGTVQKGPFSNGSELNIYELDSKLVPTGRTFHSTLTNLGNFEVNGISLISPYAELVATGFYFNEISGELSSSQLTLRAIVDLTDKENVNLNILTNLEYERVKYLVLNDNLKFQDAKEQAEIEILKIFNLEKYSISNSELLDISKIGEEDAVLLAISATILGNNSTSEMNKIISNMVTDIKMDGILDDTDIQNTLFSQAMVLNCDEIAKNIKKNYLEFGITLNQVNDFEAKVRYFVANSTYEFKSPFEFPDSTEWGKNILVAHFNKFEPGKTYTMAVQMPETGKIKVKLTNIEGSGNFSRLGLQTYGWTDHLFVENERSNTFSSNMNGTLIEAPFVFDGYSRTKIEIFMNDDITPIITKNVTWGGYNNSDYYFPDNPFHVTNLLAMNDSTVLNNDSIYKIEFADWNIITDSLDITFTFTYPSTANLQVLEGWNYSQEVIDDRLKIHFTGANGWLIKLKTTGMGTIYLNSDLLFKDGTYLKRVFFLK